MAGAVLALAVLVSLEGLRNYFPFNVGPLDAAAGAHGSNDEFCLEGFDAHGAVKFIDQRLVDGSLK